MAKLTEFESKKILQKAGVAVPRGWLVYSRSDAEEKAREAGLPLALKAQVLCTSRFKKGYIRFAETPEGLKEALDHMFSANPQAIKDKGMVLEEKCFFRDEFYVSVISDEACSSPVILFNKKGGVDIEENRSSMKRRQVDILKGVTDYDIAFLVEEKKARPALGAIIKKLYDIYREMDCSLLEINPLVPAAGGYLAVDAKMTIDSDALFRHKHDGIHFAEENLNRDPTALEIAASRIDESDHRGTVHIVELDKPLNAGGIRIGVDCVGTGVSLSVMDELIELGYAPANFGDTSGNPPASKIYRAIKLILSQKEIEGFVFASCVSSQQLDNTARGVIKALKEIYPQTNGKPDIPCVFMFRGAWDKEALELLKEHGISDSGNVVILGREATEHDAAAAFDELYKGKKRVLKYEKEIEV